MKKIIFTCLLIISFSGFISFAKTTDNPQCPKAAFYIGYDMIKGNPNPLFESKTDPGWRYTAIMNQTVNDECVTCNDTPSCGEYSEAEKIFAELDYYEDLTSKATVNSNDDNLFYETEFTGSAEYATEQQDVFAKGLIHVQTKASCQLYSATRDINCTAVDFTSGFKNSIAVFPVSTADPNWFSKVLDFINTYGTHYADSASIGARWETAAFFDRTGYDGLRVLEVDIDIAGQASAEFIRTVGKSAEWETEEERRMRVEYDKASLYRGEVTIGSLPPDSRELSDWANSITDPIPQTYNLAPLTDFFNNKFFPDDTTIDAKRLVFIEGYKKYCDSVPGCHEIPKIKHVSTTVEGLNQTQNHAIAECPESHLMISGGCQSEPMPFEPLYWYISAMKPSNSRSYSCTSNMDHPADTSNVNYWRGVTATATCIPERYIEDIKFETCYGEPNADTPTYASCYTFCEPGYVITGGGCESYNYSGQLPYKITRSYQNSNSNYWQCAVTSNHGSDESNIAAVGYAICTLFDEDTVEDIESLSQASGTQGEKSNIAVAYCPAEYEVLYGGCDVPVGNYPALEYGWKIVEHNVSKNQMSWSCVGQEDIGTDVFHQNVYAGVGCLKFKDND